MGDVAVLNTPVVASNTQTVGQQKQGKLTEEEMSLFASLFQGLTGQNLMQPLMNLNQNIEIPEEQLKALVAKLTDTLNMNDQQSNKLLQFLTGLNSEEKQSMFQMAKEITNSIEKGVAIPFDFITKEQKETLVKNVSELKTFVHSFKDEGAMAISKEMNLVGHIVNNSFSFNKVEHKTIAKNTKTLFYPANFQQKAQVSNTEQVQNEALVQKDAETSNIDINKMQVNFSAQLSHVKNMTQQVNNPQPKVENLQVNKNFSQELGKVMIKNFSLPNGATETKIQLHPQELGQLSIKLVADNGHITAQIVAETVHGKELLEGHLSQLRHSLVSQGYQIEKLEVQQTNSSSSTLLNDFKQGFNFSGQHSNKNYSNNHRPSSFTENQQEEVNDFNAEIYSTTGIDYTV